MLERTSSFVGVNWRSSSAHSGDNETISQEVIAVCSSSGDNEILFLAISKLRALFEFSTVIWSEIFCKAEKISK